jgi:uncharacterized protein YbbC (DUF1343 family)
MCIIITRLHFIAAGIKGSNMTLLFFKQHPYLVVFFLCIFSYVDCHFKLGVENISASMVKNISPHKNKESYSVGLITNQTGVDQHGRRTVDLLLAQEIGVRYIFVPEHGLNGTLAERDVHDGIDKKTKIPVISLYGNGSGKMISEQQMNNIDCLIFDIQDSGMRHYTYISTLLNTLKIAAHHHKPYIVLDRPNPLACSMQGPLVQPELISFISIAPIPLRHGMTVGELARYFNAHVLENPASLDVVCMEKYDRTVGFMGPFIHQLSPNLQSLQSCYGYSFLGLLGEIEPFEIGIGTPMAFRCIALPKHLKIDQHVWRRLQLLLSTFGVKSFLYHHTNPKNKKKSKGLRLEFQHINQLQSFELLIAILEFFTSENIPFSFSAAFDRAVGSRDVQNMIRGTVARDVFFKNIEHDLKGFFERAQSCLLYQCDALKQPAPVVFLF